MTQLALGAEADARRGFDALARDDFAGVPFDAEWLPSLCLLAVACFQFRDAARAAVLYAMLLPYAQRNVVVGIGAWTCLGPAAGQLALLATALERWDDAAGHFEDALAMNRRLGMRAWVAQYQYEYAGMLLARDAAGDRQRAGDLLAEAGTAAGAMALRRLAEDVASRGRQIGDEARLAPRTAAAAHRTRGPAKRRRLLDRRARGRGRAPPQPEGRRLPGPALFAEPGREFHVLDLMAGRQTLAHGGTGPALDAGRDHQAASATERARAAVTPEHPQRHQAFSKQVLPLLGAHLALRVKTGTFLLVRSRPRSSALVDLLSRSATFQGRPLPEPSRILPAPHPSCSSERASFSGGTRA